MIISDFASKTLGSQLAAGASRMAKNCEKPNCRYVGFSQMYWRMFMLLVAGAFLLSCLHAQ